MRIPISNLHCHLKQSNTTRGFRFWNMEEDYRRVVWKDQNTLEEDPDPQEGKVHGVSAPEERSNLQG